MTKVVINNCFGGFSISEKALYRLAELKGVTLYPEKGDFGFTTYWTVPEKPEGLLDESEFHKGTLEERQESNRVYGENTFDVRPENRADPDLIKVIEELGDDACGQCAQLKIVEIPDGVEWQIEEYDGNEWVAEKHETWR